MLAGVLVLGVKKLKVRTDDLPGLEKCKLKIVSPLMVALCTFLHVEYLADAFLGTES